MSGTSASLRCGLLLAPGRRSPSALDRRNIEALDHGEELVKHLSSKERLAASIAKMDRENLPVGRLSFKKYAEHYKNLRDQLLGLIRADSPNAALLAVRSKTFTRKYIPSDRLKLIGSPTVDFDAKWNDFVNDVRLLTYEEEFIITHALLNISNIEKVIDLLMLWSHRFIRLHAMDKKHACVDLLTQDLVRVQNILSVIVQNRDLYSEKLLADLKEYEVVLRAYIEKNRLKHTQQKALYRGLAHDDSICDKELDDEKIAQGKQAKSQRKSPGLKSVAHLFPLPPRSPDGRLNRKDREECYRRRVCASVLAYNNLPENHDSGHRKVDRKFMLTPPDGSKSASSNYAYDVSDCRVNVFSDLEMEKAKNEGIKREHPSKAQQSTRGHAKSRIRMRDHSRR